jgi:hypothetical protein
MKVADGLYNTLIYFHVFLYIFVKLYIGLKTRPRPHNSIVLYFCSFLIQAPISSLMMATYVQPKQAADFICTMKVVHRLQFYFFSFYTVLVSFTVR